jgi:acetyl-CoA synthetase
LVNASVSHKHIFDYKPGDVYACMADIGWITGHSCKTKNTSVVHVFLQAYGLTDVVYGPLANGATSVIFESLPTYPDAGRYWEMVQRLKVTQFYTAPTAIRLLIKSGAFF